MPNLAEVGRFLFTIAILAFGVQHFLYARTGTGLGPPWTPENYVPVYVVGAVLLVAAVSLAAGRGVQSTATLLSIVILARAALYYAPKVVATPRDPGPWTSLFELLAMSAASLVLAATFAGGRPDLRKRGNPLGSWLLLGRFLFAISLVIFGVQHLMYGPFIAGLIPGWLPGHLFWAYFVGVAFLAAALAIASGKVAHLAATLLGTMFLLWVVMLHAPRVADALHNSNEWTSLFVALAMSGSAFAIAGALPERSSQSVRALR